jgi:hypothetical protein
MNINALYKVQQVFNRPQNLLEHFRPLIVACTSDDIENEAIKRSIDEAGFDLAVMTPLTTQKI